VIAEASPAVPGATTRHRAGLLRLGPWGLVVGRRFGPGLFRTSRRLDQELSRLTQGVIEAKLGPITIRYGGIIVAVGLVQLPDGRDYFLRADDQNRHPADRLSLLDSFQADLYGGQCLLEFLFGESNASQGTLQLGVCLDYLGENPIAQAKELEQGLLMHRFLLPHHRIIAQTKVLELPQQLKVNRVAPAERPKVVIETSAEVSAGQRTAGIRRRSANHHSGKQGSPPFLPYLCQRGFDQSALRRQFRSVSQSDSGQIVEIAVRLDELDSPMWRFQRDDESSGFQPENAVKFGTGDFPAFIGVFQSLASPGDLSSDAAAFQTRDKTSLDQSVHPLAQVLSALESRRQTEHLAPGLLHGEIGFRHLQQHIVAHRLQFALSGCRYLPGYQWCVDRICYRKEHSW
jgi:hypothetical protein